MNRIAGSMSQSRAFRVLVVAPGATPAVVYDALTAVATIDRRCVDEVHVLTSAETVDRLSAALLKPGMPCLPHWPIGADAWELKQPTSFSAGARFTVSVAQGSQAQSPTTSSIPCGTCAGTR